MHSPMNYQIVRTYSHELNSEIFTTAKRLPLEIA